MEKAVAASSNFANGLQAFCKFFCKKKTWSTTAEKCKTSTLGIVHVGNSNNSFSTHADRKFGTLACSRIVISSFRACPISTKLSVHWSLPRHKSGFREVGGGAADSRSEKEGGTAIPYPTVKEASLLTLRHSMICSCPCRLTQKVGSKVGLTQILKSLFWLMSRYCN